MKEREIKWERGERGTRMSRLPRRGVAGMCQRRMGMGNGELKLRNGVSEWEKKGKGKGVLDGGKG